MTLPSVRIFAPSMINFSQHQPCRSLLLLLVMLINLWTAQGIPVDNGVIGEPEIECGSENIYVSFNTQGMYDSKASDNGVIGEPEIECGSEKYIRFLQHTGQNHFDGHVYVKGHYDIDYCRTDSSKNHFDGHVYVKGHYDIDYCRTDSVPGFVANINVPFAQCGTRRQRSLNPPGMYLTTVVIITFHPAFITKVDRAYEIRCYYMEATKTVQQQLDVSMLTTVDIVTDRIDMPRCRYEVLRGGPFGQPVRYAVVTETAYHKRTYVSPRQYAVVGETVYHKWTCETPTVGVFCMRVHSCYVDDGHGTAVEIVDYNGCSLDRYIMQNLDYTSDLMAGQESHVFKYADRPSLYFQCQISLIIREDNYCPVPKCEDAGVPNFPPEVDEPIPPFQYQNPAAGKKGAKRIKRYASASYPLHARRYVSAIDEVLHQNVRLAERRTERDVQEQSNGAEGIHIASLDRQGSPGAFASSERAERMPRHATGAPPSQTESADDSLGERSRQRLLADAHHHEYLIDVASRELNILDLNDTLDELPDWSRFRTQDPADPVEYSSDGVVRHSATHVCLAKTTFYLVTAIVFCLMFTGTGVILGYVFLRRRRSKRDALKQYLDHQAGLSSFPRMS